MNNEQFELAARISKYFQGVLTAEEEKDLLTLAQQNEEVRQLMEQYSRTEILTEDLALLETVDTEKDWNSVLQKMNQPAEVGKTPSLNGKWWAIAAGISIIFTVMIWTSLNKKEQPLLVNHQHTHKNDVLPGGNKAILTLSNGKQVNIGDQDSLHVSDGQNELLVGRQEISYASDKAEDQAKSNRIRTPKGGTFIVGLPDGSRVWLNSESEIEFPLSFSGTERNIKLLAGEAFFKIAKNHKKPFIVQTDFYNVEVTGTEFNINTYDKDMAKTILTEGNVRVRKGTELIAIEPGYAVSSTKNQLSVSKVDVEEALAWRDGYFYFDGKNLNQILLEISRWYDVEIKYESAIQRTRYNGGIKRSATLATTCKMLTDLSGHSFKIDGNKLIVK